MQLILTHSNTDFDGLAAQLAAAKLYPGALPVLSPHLNENVRSFLALARDELPFVQVSDLPDQPVERLILVDTAQAPRIAALGDALPPLLIIDHHPPGEQELRPEDERLEGEAGSTTTLLVERLAESAVQLTGLEATLLLLGIYEDTGSLALPGTRRADLICAAWLMDQGARLEAIGEFLARRLSPAQQEVERDLEQAMRIELVAGWPVLLSVAQIEGPVPELSPLAHTLRDRYAPAVCVLAIGTSDAGTQLIVRANADALDAGALASRFGGGGHAAAAAAFVREQRPHDVLAQVEPAIRELIRPAQTAADLMTGQVRSVPLHATVGQAAAIQARSGHTALPVLDEQRVVHGLIARRDLDRALRHGLGDAPIERYMWRGPRLILPDLPLAELRAALLDDEGRITGRLLVVDDRRRLLGIVTRADVLRAWQDATHIEGDDQADSSVALDTFLPRGLLALLRQAAELAEQRGWSLYVVGGTVRDMLLGREPGDLDLVVEGDAIGLALALAEALGGQVRSHAQFGTATVEFGPELSLDLQGTAEALAAAHPETEATRQATARPLVLDFVTARTEFYERPAALPEVEAASLRYDLHRRDFTINTLAICLNPARYGRLYDFYGGRRDLERRLIRVLHNLSFIDDPTRVLRAARLAARLDCTIEPRTRALIADALDNQVLERAGPQRVMTELLLTLGEQTPEQALALMDALGVLRSIHPALGWLPEMRGWFEATRLEQLPEREHVALGLALLTFPLSAEEREALALGYRLGARLSRILRDITTLRERMEELSGRLPDSRLDQLLNNLDDIALRAAQIAASPAVQRQVARYREMLRDVRIALDGNDLRALGLRPGPQFRALLDGLRAARLDGQAVSRDEQLAWVRRTAGLR